jgi:hypothetical protein
MNSAIDVIDITKISTPDLGALIEILSRCKPDVVGAAECGEIQVGSPIEPSPGGRRTARECMGAR